MLMYVDLCWLISEAWRSWSEGNPLFTPLASGERALSATRNCYLAWSVLCEDPPSNRVIACKFKRSTTTSGSPKLNSRRTNLNMTVEPLWADDHPLRLTQTQDYAGGREALKKTKNRWDLPSHPKNRKNMKESVAKSVGHQKPSWIAPSRHHGATDFSLNRRAAAGAQGIRPQWTEGTWPPGSGKCFFMFFPIFFPSHLFQSF